MTLKTTKLRDAIAFALIAGSVGVVCSTSAYAQDSAEDQPAQSQSATNLDAITVTGSRVVIPGVTSNSPIVGLDREEIMRSQPITAEEFIRQLPGVTTPIGPGVNNGSDGGARLDLRSLGSNRSVVLLDGRRMVPYTLGGQVDINTIPVQLLQSVDVVTGGASAVYGADAIGGVANFILRRDFEGAEFSASYGQSHRSDQARQRIDAIIGANTDDGRGNVVLSIGHTKANPLTQGQREIGEVSLGSNNGLPQGSATAVPTVFNNWPNMVIDPDTGLRTNPGAGVIDVATGQVIPYDAVLHGFNFNPQNYFYTPMDRYQVAALARFEINNHAELYTQAFYTRSQVTLNLASSGLFLNAMQTNIGNPYMPEPARQTLCTLNNIPAAECVLGNTSRLVTITPGRRITELGPRIQANDTKTFQYVAGVRGDITDNWRYDAYWTYGESESQRGNINWGSLSKSRQALIAGNTTTCVNTANNCVPLNIWGPEGSITQQQLNFINLSSYATQRVRQEIGSGTVSGDFGDFKVPWSDYPIGVAVGVETRKAYAETRSDAASQIQGEVMGTGAPFPDRQGSFRLNEIFGEAIVPIISGAPGADLLSLELGYRHSDFSIEGNSFDYGTYKYGLEWAPIQSLRFRGMFQHATRAPSIGELFAPEVTGLANLAVDPCGGNAVNQAQANTPGTLSNLCRLTGVPVSLIGSLPQPSAGQVNVLAGGNRRLEAETADTRTLGLVWSPSFGDTDLVVTFDYWEIELENMISAPAVGDVLNGCYTTALNPGLGFNSLCALIGRSPTDGGFNDVNARGIALQSSNLGRMSTDGYDLGVHYGFNLANDSRVSLRADASWVRSHQFQATPASIDRDCLGYYSTDCGVGPAKFRGNLTASWSISDLELWARWNHLGKMELEGIKQGGAWLEAYKSIPAYNYFDLGIAYNAPWNSRISLTVNNVANKAPPVVGNTIGTTATNSGNTFPQTYDVIGRYITLGVNFQF